ncbi:MAG TPA: RNA pseudouridine synthase, partial [Acidobacteriota bacterium]
AIDPIYGKTGPIYLSQLKKDYKPKGEVEKPLIDRLPLHAFRLSFRDPTEEKTLVLEAPLPRDIARTLKLLRKYAPL